MQDKPCSARNTAGFHKAPIAWPLPESLLADAVRLFNPDPSRSVGLDAETGSIEAGKAADCVLVEAGAR